MGGFEGRGRGVEGVEGRGRRDNRGPRRYGGEGHGGGGDYRGRGKEEDSPLGAESMRDIAISLPLHGDQGDAPVESVPSVSSAEEPYAVKEQPLRTPPLSQSSQLPPNVAQEDKQQKMVVEDSGQSLVPSRVGYQIPVRADLNKAGEKGRKTRVRTNHLALNVKTLKHVAWHYDVAIDPDKPKRLLRFAVEEFRRQNFSERYPAFDGRKNLYSSEMLPFDHNSQLSSTVRIRDEERQQDKEYKITLKYATKVDLTSLFSYMRTGSSLDAPQQAIQVLDVVLRCAPALQFISVGRSFFSQPTGQVIPLGDGYEMWYGLFQSVNLGWLPFVNVDVAHKGFPQSQPVIEAIKEVCGSYKFPVNPDNELTEYQLMDLKKFLIGLKIDYVIPGNLSSRRTYKVNGIVESPSRLTFTRDDGSKISIEEYFAKEKRCPLRYRNLPCLHVGSPNRTNPIYLPVEFCTVTAGQAVRKRYTEKQTANMVKIAATSTMEREKKIRDSLSRAKYNESPQVREFGLHVDEKFTEVPARVLTPPQLQYNINEAPILPKQGVWQPKTFLNGMNLRKWSILALDRYITYENMSQLSSILTSCGRKLGMQIAEPYPVKNIASPRINQEMPKCLEECKSNGTELIFFIVKEKGDDYACVKRTAELRYGILTQCIKSLTVQRKLNNATAINILQKVNSKLNGINHSMHISSRPKILGEPIMIVGADVTHPSPDETKIPSVAAVCASHDPKAFQYNTQFRIQEAKEEIIQDLDKIMIDHLWFFYNRTKYHPKRIVFFRDGVSEGQFQKVLNHELTAIRRACTSLNVNYKPSITFLVVQKRHHTRFFPMSPQDCDGKNKNVMPGTIVDTIITHPTERGYYLVSHSSIQGVSRPTKYHCLWDDNGLSDDELEELSYYLCHLFSRCTRSVSYPAPTYYAHLAAFRVRVYLNDRIKDSHKKLQTEKLTELQGMNPMYFV